MRCWCRARPRAPVPTIVAGLGDRKKSITPRDPRPLVSILDFALRCKNIYGPADGIFPTGSGSVLVTVAPLSRAAKKALIASATWLDAFSRHRAEASASPSFSLER